MREPDDLAAELVAELRDEFGDPFSDVWGRTGADAWETVIGMFTHVGWVKPSDGPDA